MHKAAGATIASDNGPEGLAGSLEKGRLYTHDNFRMHELSPGNQPPLRARGGEIDVEL